MDKLTIGAQPLMFPMPTVLVGSNVNGKANYMAVAWVGVANMAPPMLCVAINHVRHTYKGIEENGTFSVNIPSAKQLVETDHCGMVSGAREDKSAVFETFYGKLKNAPLAKECPVNVECKVFQKVDCGSHVLVIGQIEEIHISPDCMTGGHPDISKVDPIIYSFGDSGYWKVGEKIGKGFSAGRSYQKK
ncbi:flavin reductase family protein [Methanocella sp. MCL-LM]|uniref:flavin reductase family protein n=1 Tax=Methanocella sp. MCL-LM TaxID=3412035 RepID=UPI003C72D0A4